MSFYFQKKVVKGNNGAHYYVEPSGYRRYVDFWDVRKRSPEDIFMFPELPKELNQIIWHFKMQLECSENRWDYFVMDLTNNQYHHFKSKAKTHKEHLSATNFIYFALHNFPANSRIYNKAQKQLLNY